jgi:hypothetical protein
MNSPETIFRSASPGVPFANRTSESTVGPCRLIVLPVAVENVVSFAGSIRTSPDFALGEDILQQLATLTLDKGTKKRDRFAVAELIDNRGAQISFRSSPRRVTFSGRSLCVGSRGRSLAGSRAVARTFARFRGDREGPSIVSGRAQAIAGEHRCASLRPAVENDLFGRPSELHTVPYRLRSNSCRPLIRPKSDPFMSGLSARTN